MQFLQDAQFSNLFASLSDGFYSRVRPEPIEAYKLVSLNHALANALDLEDLSDYRTDIESILACTDLPTSSAPLASVYAGHQFGQFNPQLGDGRALMIGGITNSKNQHWELQLKGSGKTPYSRFGDGKAVLRSTIREYLCSEAMHGLGIATTRALAMGVGETPVYREQTEKAATVIRMAPTFIRFGHFEYFFYEKRFEELEELIEFTIHNYFPEAIDETREATYKNWLMAITEKTATMIADWQTVGFCHGVMNTDNMSILGLTIDYGPFGFLDDFNPGHICNHSDHSGRYAYNQQVNIGLWNLNALAHALSPFIPVEDIKDCLMRYEPVFLERFRQNMCHKLGLTSFNSETDKLITDLLNLLAKEQTDYTWFFRTLSEELDASYSLRDHFIDRDAFDKWNEGFEQLQKQDSQSTQDRQASMLKNNPKYILRNYLAQQAIEKAEAGNFSMVNGLLKVLSEPFEEHSGYEALAERPPEWGKKLQVSCSS